MGILYWIVLIIVCGGLAAGISALPTKYVIPIAIASILTGIALTVYLFQPTPNSLTLKELSYELSSVADSSFRRFKDEKIKSLKSRKHDLSRSNYPGASWKVRKRGGVEVGRVGNEMGQKYDSHRLENSILDNQIESIENHTDVEFLKEFKNTSNNAAINECISKIVDYDSSKDDEHSNFISFWLPTNLFFYALGILAIKFWNDGTFFD